MEFALITQARMGSSRLPDKIFLNIGEHIMLHYHLERLKQTGLPVIVATTLEDVDAQVYEYAINNGVRSIRGSESNVLSRFYDAAEKFGVEHIIRVTSDCPLIDPLLISKGVEAYQSAGKNHLYLSNCLERTFPRGMDFEIFSFPDLKEAYNSATKSSDLEHVTPYINQNRSGKVNIAHYTNSVDNSDLRLTVDTPEDFELMKILILELGADKLSCDEIVALMRTNKELLKINAHIEQKKI